MGTRQSHDMNNDNQIPPSIVPTYIGMIQKYGKENDPSLILPYLFIGSSYVNENPAILSILKVSHVLNVANEVDANPELFKIPFLKIVKLTTDDIRKEFDTAFVFIDLARNSGNRIVIHCKNGRSRATVIAIAYLMNRYRVSLAWAYNFVKSKRPEADPKKNFIEILEKYENELKMPFIV